MRSIVLTLFALFSLSTHAQLLDGLETALLAKDDAQALIQGYTSPLAKSFIYGLNTGWAHTAKTHKQLGFDLTVGVGASMAADADLRFMPSGLRYVSVPESGLPTVFGDSNSVPLQVRIPANNETDELTATLNFPGGSGDDLPINGLPVPTAQLGIGVALNTDLIVRFVPETELEGTTVGLWGLGFKHDLTQYLGPIDKLPFNLALLVAQTKISAQYAVAEAGSSTLTDFSLTAQTAQVLGSLDFPIVSIFGAVGFSRGSADLALKGTYELNYIQSVAGQDLPTTTQITDPVSLSYRASSPLATLGLRLNLPIIKIYGQYSLQEYQTASVGVAISVR